jgi:tetratricopeptide (TPR) repeat protein
VKSAASVAAALLLVAATSSADPRAAPVSPADLARIDSAVAQHGDDPDLAWTAAIAHLRAGDPSALQLLSSFEARWPGMHPEAALELGKALAAGGRNAEALEAFDRALSADPHSGPAELHRGLVLRSLGRTQEADEALARAAVLAPELAPETLLLRGFDAILSGDQQAAGPLLHKAIDLDPAGETARRARLLLPEPNSYLGRWIGLVARTGYEYDSNVTLDSGLPIGATGAKHADSGPVFGAGIVVRPLQREKVDLSLGYRFDGTMHLDLDQYDLQNHLAYISLLDRATTRTALRFDGIYERTFLADHDYGESYIARANLFHSFGETLGVTHLYGDFGHLSYFQSPTLSSLDRDGNAYGVGVEHSFSLPFWRPALLTVGTRGSRFDSEAQRDVLGFLGAYDYTRFEGNVLLRAPLLWKIQSTAGVSLAYELYDNANVIDFLTDNGSGDLNPDKRRDLVTDVAVSLLRPISRRMDVELGWRFTHRESNVDLYGYDRHVVGLYFNVHTD